MLDARLVTLREQVRAVVPDGADLDAITAHHQQVAELARRCTDIAADLVRARAAADRTRRAGRPGSGREAGFDVVGRGG